MDVKAADGLQKPSCQDQTPALEVKQWPIVGGSMTG
jgi:hypothetical protein